MKTILTCAVTGSGTTLKQNPNLPITPEQIATSALDAATAGAAVVHLHVRDPVTGEPSMDINLYKEVFDRIKQKNTDVIINLTTGPGSTGSSGVVFGQADPLFKSAEERVAHILELHPDICSLDFNTMNRGPKNITVNSIPVVREMARLIKQTGVKPELEIFDSGDLHIAKTLIADGLIEGEPLWQIATGINYGWNSSIGTLLYAHQLLPKDATWYAFGIGSKQMPFVALSTIHGGHARVGLEDNVFIERGVLAKTNAELVTKAVRIIQDLGNTIATPAEARNILQLLRVIRT
jgi:uncharacterized protein (DUF849 family)